ncbi:MAG TPA: SsrA-binding protein, partial [Bacteroidia bacterium]|nr:SsrA-binding protein [Bacteroidia bacterium]
MEEINITTNKKAHFQYQVSDTFEAGLQLTGTEIKSVRAMQVNLNESYCTFTDGELFVKGMHIAEYKY